MQRKLALYTYVNFIKLFIVENVLKVYKNLGAHKVFTVWKDENSITLLSKYFQAKFLAVISVLGVV